MESLSLRVIIQEKVRLARLYFRYAEEPAILDSEEEQQQILKEFAGMLKDKKQMKMKL